MKISTLPRALRLLPLLLVLPSCAQARPAHPALWRVSNGGHSAYFFGTIHALPANEDWHTPAILNAERDATSLVLELTDGDDKAQVVETLRHIAFAPNQPDVLARVPDAQRAALSNLIAQSGAPLPALKAYKTWAVYLMVLNPLLLKSIGIDGAEGVERKLAIDFKASGKTIEGLETVKYQLGIFDALPEAVQRHMLAEVVTDFPRAKADFYKTLAAWESGDPAQIARYFDKDLQTEPELRRVLLHDRNAKWAQWTLERLQQPGTAFVAVGAGHLAGNDSVIAMLRARGLRVTRVE